MSGLSVAAYTLNAAAINRVFVGALLSIINVPAAVATGRTLRASNVIDMAVAPSVAAGSALELKTHPRRLNRQNMSSILTYKIATSNAGLSFDALDAAISGGSTAFTKSVAALALAGNVTQLYGVTCPPASVTNLNTINSPTDIDGPSTTSIVTLVAVGAGIILCLVGLYGLYYVRKYYCRRSMEAERPNNDARISAASTASEASTAGRYNYFGRGYRPGTNESPRDQDMPRGGGNFTGNVLRDPRHHEGSSHSHGGQGSHGGQSSHGGDARSDLDASVDRARQRMMRSTGTPSSLGDVIPSARAQVPRGSLAGTLMQGHSASDGLQRHLQQLQMARPPSFEKQVRTAGELHANKYAIKEQAADDEVEEDRTSFPMFGQSGRYSSGHGHGSGGSATLPPPPPHSSRAQSVDNDL